MTLLSDFLKQLGVAHTESYSDKAFNTMSFKSLFGFSRLLDSYGVESEAVKLPDKKLYTELPRPYLAQVKSCFVIVTDIRKEYDGSEMVDFLHFGQPKKWKLEDFERKATGVVLLAKATKDSREPEYAKHHFFDVVEKGKFWVLIFCALFLVVSGFVIDRFWSNLSTIFLTLVNFAGIAVTWLLILKTLKIKSKSADRICGVLQEHGCDHVLEQKASTFFGLSTIFLTLVNFAGIAVTWLLILKTLKIKSKSADRICGVLQEHGCDHVLEQKASTFFGIFSWSEVGITYFSISTLILFLFPGEIHYLALLNGCCLPFTVWSIWYQKYRIKTWCTLCVTTQGLLWLQFFCYLFGGWWSDIFPLRLSLFMMVAAYGAALMAVNRVMNFIKSR